MEWGIGTHCTPHFRLQRGQAKPSEVSRGEGRRGKGKGRREGVKGKREKGRWERGERRGEKGGVTKSGNTQDGPNGNRVRQKKKGKR